MISINRAFVREWAGVYDQRQRPRDRDIERRIKAWLRGQAGVKHLDKGHFVDLASWKTPRARPAYERNGSSLIRDATSLASRATNDRLKIYILRSLDGVSVTVAATILHFMHPRTYPIFDRRARQTLKKAGLLPRRVTDARVEAWLDYVVIMRRVARQRRVSLRDLDKALFEYDRRPRRRSRR